MPARKSAKSPKPKADKKAQRPLSEEEIDKKLRALEPRWGKRPAPRFAKEIQGKDEKALLGLLAGKDPAARAEAAAALGAISSKKAAPALKQALSDKFPPVRQAAAAALAALGDRAMLDEFIKALRDEDPRVVAGAAAAIGASGQKEAVPYLLEAFRTTNPYVGSAIARALGALGDRQAVQWLAAALKNNFIPAEAAEALGLIGSAGGAKELLAAANHVDAHVRAAAARSIGLICKAEPKAFDFMFREQMVLPALRKLVADQSPKVKLCAAISLTELGDEAGGEAIASALGD
ncbi:MAG: HEAT repeat domain-containing protein [Myxococcales bacterium]|nr:HEAT repeat domain-containing protein [Myxococcales bacterium]